MNLLSCPFDTAFATLIVIGMTTKGRFSIKKRPFVWIILLLELLPLLHLRNKYLIRI